MGLDRSQRVVEHVVPMKRIAIEIVINIRLCLGSNTLPIKMVVATALMAIARKVIVLDLEKTSSGEILAIGVVTLALGITYWLVGNSDRTTTEDT